MALSHSRAYRSLMSARSASSALVAGPGSARFLKRPRRSPMLDITVTARPAVSASTLPTNASVFAWSILCCVVMSFLLFLLAYCSSGRWALFYFQPPPVVCPQKGGLPSSKSTEIVPKQYGDFYQGG